MTDLSYQVAQNRQLHQSDPEFGINTTGLTARLPLAVKRLSQSMDLSSVLDYGTGKGLLVDHFRSELSSSIVIDGYDPSVDKWSKKPDCQYDIVTCIDVLEHIDLQYLDSVLADLNHFTKYICYVTIDLQPAVKTLDDGRNAHVLLAPAEWWVSRFSQIFPSITCFPIKHINSTNQKIVLACTHDAALLPAVFLLLNKLKLYSLTMKGGTIKTSPTVV